MPSVGKSLVGVADLLILQDNKLLFELMRNSSRLVGNCNILSE